MKRKTERAIILSFGVSLHPNALCQRKAHCPYSWMVNVMCDQFGKQNKKKVSKNITHNVHFVLVSTSLPISLESCSQNYFSVNPPPQKNISNIKWTKRKKVTRLKSLYQLLNNLIIRSHSLTKLPYAVCGWHAGH